MKIPQSITQMITSFERLPGIGPKTAARLTYYLLHVPQIELDRFAYSLQNLQKQTIICSVCFAVDDVNPCSICTDQERDQGIITVIEQPLDVLAIERSRSFKGVYHVLHGVIDPLNSIGPDEIRISELVNRVKAAYANGFGEPKEIILATNPTMEGEATAMYIAKKLGELKSQIHSTSSGQVSNLKSLKVTRIGRGLPTGADLEYADPMTLMRALEGRSDYG